MFKDILLLVIGFVSGNEKLRKQVDGTMRTVGANVVKSLNIGVKKSDDKLNTNVNTDNNSHGGSESDSTAIL